MDTNVPLGVTIAALPALGVPGALEVATRAEAMGYHSFWTAEVTGESVTFEGEFYSCSRFTLGVRLGERRPKVVVGALNPKMLRMAGEVADGVLLNYLPSSHVPWSVEQIRAGGDAAVYAYVHCSASERADGIDAARRDLFSYAVVDSYARNFDRAGFSEEVAAIRAAHAARDREGALAAVSDRMVDGIDFMGDRDGVASYVQAYVDAGVQHPVLMPNPWGPDRMQVVDDTLRAAIGA